MISNMLTIHECVVLTVMQKLFIVWTCYLLVISLYTNGTLVSFHSARLKILPKTRIILDYNKINEVDLILSFYLYEEFLCFIMNM